MSYILCIELWHVGLLKSGLLGIIFGNYTLSRKALIILAALCHITTGSRRRPVVSSEWVAFFMVINLSGPAVRHLTSQLTTDIELEPQEVRKLRFPQTGS